MWLLYANTKVRIDYHIRSIALLKIIVFCSLDDKRINTDKYRLLVLLRKDIFVSFRYLYCFCIDNRRVGYFVWIILSILREFFGTFVFKFMLDLWDIVESSFNINEILPGYNKVAIVKIFIQGLYLFNRVIMI